MAPRKPRQVKAHKSKQNARKPKTKRVFTGSTPDDGGNPTMQMGAGSPPDDLPHLTENRPDFPCSLSLSNLVRLDWQHRQELFPHGPGASKLERVGFKGRAYDVESLEPGATGNKFVYLYPEKRYYYVPIYEEGQSPDAPQRFLLVRSRDDTEEPGPHIFVVEPLQTPALNEPFAQLHIIGGEDDAAAAEPLRHTAGIVEAVLTATETIPDQPATSPATPLSQPTTSSESSATTPLDEDLLSCIDVLAIAQSSRPDAAKDFDAAHNKFLGYVQKRYGLENIPITLHQTMFDPVLGHSAATTLNNPALPDNVIVRVLRDGYRRDHIIVRDAHVVVNKRDGRAGAAQARITTQPTPEPSTPLETKTQQLDKPDDGLLRCIDNFNQAIGYRPAIEQDLTPLRNCLLAHLRQRYSWEIIPIVLNTTQFDEKQGHRGVGISYLSSVGDGVIVAVQSNGYTCDDKVVRDAQVVVNHIPSHITKLNKLVRLRRNQIYLEIVARRGMSIDEVLHDMANQVGVMDGIYSLLTIFTAASPVKIRYLAEQLNSGAATSSLIRENVGQTLPLNLRYQCRIPEIYVMLKGAVDPLGALRQILTSEATQRSGTNYFLQTNRSWLTDLLRKLRHDGLLDDDYTAFANDIARRLEQITFTTGFSANIPM